MLWLPHCLEWLSKNDGEAPSRSIFFSYFLQHYPYDPQSPVSYDALFPQLRDAELLVLDDLGAQRSSPWADEKLFQLLNYHYNYGWPTVITINTRAWSHLEERIRSRLQDAGLVTLVDMADAQDYRLHQGKNISRRGGPEVGRSQFGL